MPSFVRFAVALAMVLVSAAETRAEPLLSRGGGSVAALPGVSQATRVAPPSVRSAASAERPTVTRVDGFPLGASRTVALELRRDRPAARE